MNEESPVPETDIIKNVVISSVHSNLNRFTHSPYIIVLQCIVLYVFRILNKCDERLAFEGGVAGTIDYLSFTR